jgi:hypothetical protein
MANFTPEQLAQIAAMERGPYGITEPSARAFNVYSGSSATPPQAAQSQVREYLRGIREKGVSGYNELMAKAPGAYEGFVKNARNVGLTSRNVGGTGAVLGGVGIAAQQFSQDQPVGAIAAIPGSMLVGGLASAGINTFTKGMPGPAGTLLRTAVPIVGSLLGGAGFAAGAEGAKNFITGEQIGKKPETAKTDAPKYAGNIPLNESARMLDLARAVDQQGLEMYKQQTATDMAFNRQMLQYQLESDMQRMKAQMPFVTKLKNDDLVRSQALLNTQGNVDARLGLLATQGALAKGAQAEAGAFMRTAISTNPYVNAATRQSPNIQFG